MVLGMILSYRVAGPVPICVPRAGLQTNWQFLRMGLNNTMSASACMAGVHVAAAAVLVG